MKILPGSLYDYPRYYELAYGSDWRAELRFLSECFAEHAGRKVRSVFEPACGTGRVLLRLAKAGHRVGGVDLNPAQVAYCNARLEKAAAKGRVEVGDMTAFTVGRPFDAAINLINSFRHLSSEAAARAHLACIEQALAPGGVYILAMHLTPAEEDPLGEETWSSRRGHLAVAARLQSVKLDRRGRKQTVEADYQIYTPSEFLRLNESMTFRTYTWRQMQITLAASALELVATYDFGYDTTRQTIIDAQTEDVVFVLRKRK